MSNPASDMLFSSHGAGFGGVSLPPQGNGMTSADGVASAAAVTVSAPAPAATGPGAKKKARRGADSAAQKRRCVSTACVACRKRKSKCDGALPSCAACASVYCTECVYDPNSDHRRKGVYREKTEALKAQSSTLQILIEAILNAAEEDVPNIVKRIRTCDSLDVEAEAILKKEAAQDLGEQVDDLLADDLADNGDATAGQPVEGEFELARKMVELRLENDSVRFIGGTSHLIYLGGPDSGEPSSTGGIGDGGVGDGVDGGSGGGDPSRGGAPGPYVGGGSGSGSGNSYGGLGMGGGDDSRGAVARGAGSGPFASGSGDAGLGAQSAFEEPYTTAEEAINSWTNVTSDTALIMHLMNMYFNWHYTYFTTLSRSLFYRDFFRGRPRVPPSRTVYCTKLLVNAMLALGCHFTSVPGAFAVAGDSRTKGDHFFARAKQLIVENDEYEKPRLATVQALALMSVREAGCAREAKGWVYSGMSFRMAQDIGLAFEASGSGGASNAAVIGSDHYHPGGRHHQMSEGEIDARRLTFWGCFLFDKAWSNYLGRLPQLPKNSYSVPKYDVFPDEDAEPWAPLTDAGQDMSQAQPSRTRAAGLQLSKLCEISSDLLLSFYHPIHIGRSSSKATELKKLGEIQQRLEEWHRDLPKEFAPREGQLPNMILTHMFFHLQYIHLFRPFLKYAPGASPLPAHVSPRRICSTNAGAISKLMRLYKKTYNLRQICNIAVYMVHSACIIHLLNLPEKTAKRDIIHGVKNLEEIAEDWLCARRTLCILSVLARKWNVDLPEEARLVLQRSDDKYGTFNTADVPSPARPGSSNVGPASQQVHAQAQPQTQIPMQPQPQPQLPQLHRQPQPQPQLPQLHSQPQPQPQLPQLHSQPQPQQQLQPQSQPSPPPQLHPSPQVHSLPPQTVSLPAYHSHELSISGAMMPDYHLGSMAEVAHMAPAVVTTGGVPSSMAGALANSGWSSLGSMPSLSSPSLSMLNYTTSHAPDIAGHPQSASHHFVYKQAAPAAGQTRQLSPPGGGNILEGQEFFLTDGVSWKDHFQSWGPQASQLMQQQQQQQQQYQQQQHQNQHQRYQQYQHTQANSAGSPSNMSTGDTNTPGSDTNLHLFRGMHGNDLDLSFECISGSVGSLDGLGLD